MEQLFWILCLSTMKSQVPRLAQVSEKIIFYSECRKNAFTYLNESTGEHLFINFMLQGECFFVIIIL